MEDILAIVLLFGGGTCVAIAFSPIGQALAARLRGPAELPSEEVEALRETVAGLNDQVAALGHQVAELAERQDFAERVIAQQQGRALGGGAAR